MRPPMLTLTDNVSVISVSMIAVNGCSFLQHVRCFLWSSTWWEPIVGNICCSEETYVHRIDIFDRLLFCVCLLVQPYGLLFCSKWDKPWCFLLSTLFTTGFPVFGDLLIHRHTCFRLFLASVIPCYCPIIYPPSSDPVYFSFLLIPCILPCMPARWCFPLFNN